MSEVERTSISSRRLGGIVARTGVKVGRKNLAPASQLEVERLLGSAEGRRATTPVRKAFVRTADPKTPPPLAQIVSTRGRGGAVPLKLYLGLIRRSSAEPYDSTLPARRWAALLGLDDADQRGARRVNDAIRRLEELRLIEVETSRGAASRITLLREDGSGSPYRPPSERKPSRASRRAMKQPVELYLQMPDPLWKGYIQRMVAPELAMLLILLAEPASVRGGMWWSTQNFPDWYCISSSMRTTGTRALEELGLVRVEKRMLDTPRGSNDDERDRVRNIYHLTGAAHRPDSHSGAVPSPSAKSAAAVTRGRGRVRKQVG